MPYVQIGSQLVEVSDAIMQSMRDDNKNSLWTAMVNYRDMDDDFNRQLIQDVFDGIFSPDDWSVAARGENAGETPLIILVTAAIFKQDIFAWGFLQQLVNRDLLPPDCWDAHAAGLSPLLMIMISALNGVEKAWDLLKSLTEKGKLTVAHWNTEGRFKEYAKVTPFFTLLLAVSNRVENSEEFLKNLLAHLDFDAQCFSTPIIKNGVAFTLFEDLMLYKNNWEILELLVDHNCWPDINHWQIEVIFPKCPKRSAIWVLVSEACQKGRPVHRLLEKVMSRITWTPEIWNTVPADCKDNPITALWLLVLSINSGENAAGLAAFSQLIDQNCVTTKGLHVTEKTGPRAGKTIPLLLLNISDPLAELVWDVLKKLVDRRLIHKFTWNMPDAERGYTPIYLLFMNAIKGSQPAFEILIKLIEQGVVDKEILQTKIKSQNTTLIKDAVRFANSGNQVALAFFGHCAAAGFYDFYFQSVADRSTLEKFSREPKYWQDVEATFAALTAGNASATVVAQKYITRLHAIADAAPCDPKFVVEFKIKLHVMYAKYFMRCGLVLQTIEQVQAAAAHKSRDIGFDEIFAEFDAIIEYYKTHSEGRWWEAYNMGQQCLAYAKSVKKKGAKVKSLEEKIKECKATYLRNISKDSRWQLTENHDFILTLTESQAQALQDGDLKLSNLFNNVVTDRNDDAKMLIIKNPMAVEQALLSVILSASDDRLLVTVVRKPSPEVTSEDEFAKNLEMQCSLNDDIYKRGVTCVGRVPDGPAPYFSQADIEKPYERILALPTPSLELPAEVYFWPPIAVTSDSGFVEFVTVRNALLAEYYEDLAKIFDPERKQIRFLCGGEVGAHGGAKRVEIATPEGPWPMLLLKFCNNRGDETRALATKIGDSDVYEVTGAPFDHKQEDRMLKGHKITFR